MSDTPVFKTTDPKKPASLHDFTTPAFIQNTLLPGTSRSDIASGTCTFLKFKDGIFALTCRHVLEQACLVKQHIEIMTKEHAYPLDLRPVLTRWLEFDYDIAISKIDHYWPDIQSRSHKRAIDLDKWRQPNWSNVEMAMTIGWINGDKELTDTDVITSGPIVYLPVHPISSGTRTFTLHAELNEPSKIYLSGISGGAVFTEPANGVLDEAQFFGIVFEGFPSTRENVEIRNEDAIFSSNYLSINGYIVTPKIFDDWLTRL